MYIYIHIKLHLRVYILYIILYYISHSQPLYTPRTELQGTERTERTAYRL
jgi:hypothetical protein